MKTSLIKKSRLSVVVLIILFSLSVTTAAQILLNGNTFSSLPSPQAEWLFSGNANDSSGNGYNGTVVGPTLIADRNGFESSAYDFDGSNDYIGIGNNIFNGLTQFSVSAWINPDSIPSNGSPNGHGLSEGYIIHKAGAADDIFGLTVTTGGTAFYIDTGVDRTLIGSAPSLNEWTHIVAVYDGSSMQIYMNGQLDASQGASGTLIGNTNTVEIGARTNQNLYFNGRIDDVIVYTQSLTTEQVNTLYNSSPSAIGFTSLNSGLIRNFEFSGDSKDSSAYSGHLNVTGATLTTDRDSNTDAAYAFDGAGDSLTDSTSTDLQLSGDMSFSSWINLNSIGSGTIVDMSNTGDTQNANILYKIRMSTTGDITYTHEYNAGANQDYSYNTNLVSGQWYHVVFTRDSSANTVELYIDGALFDTYTYTEDPNGGTTGFFSIGSNSSNNDLNGKIDDVKMYNRVLTASEISQLYGDGSTGGESRIESSSLHKNLVAHYKFDADSKDSSAYSQHATNNGATLIADRFGNASSAYSFDGTNDWMSINHEFWSTSPDGLAVSMWTKDNVGGSSTGMRMHPAGGGQAQRILNIHFPFSDGTIYFDVGDGSGYDRVTMSSAGVDFSEWNHWVFTKDANANTMTIYLNGQVAATGGSKTRAIGIPANGSIGGTVGGGEYQNMDVDDVRIYNRVLTSSEINSLYTQTNN